MTRHLVSALILSGAMSAGAWGQTPTSTSTSTSTSPAATRPAPPKSPTADTPPPAPVPAALPDRPADRKEPAPARNPAAVAQAAREPRDLLSARGRFANPGGIGRYSEYYTPFTPMTTSYPGPSNRVAGFGQGGGPSRAEQIEAFRVGQFRTQNIQNNINAYGRPVGFGFGYGYGYGGGFGRGYGGYPR